MACLFIPTHTHIIREVDVVHRWNLRMTFTTMYVDAENAISMFWEWFNWTEISNVGELIDVEYHAIHAGWTINDIVVYREKK